MDNQIKGGQIVYEIIIKQASNGSAEIKKAEVSLNQLGKTASKTAKEVENAGKTSASSWGRIKDVFAGLGLYNLVTGMVTSIVNFGKASIEAFKIAEQSTIQFNNAMQNVAGTTKEQTKALNDYIQVLEEKTSIDDKQIRIGAQVFAQDQIHAENIQKLLPGLLDLAVANKDVGEMQDKVRGTAVALGRAMATGNIGVLSKQNIVGIDAQTEAMFKMGNEAERTAILVELMAKNGGGAAEAYGNSFAGQVNKAQDAVEDMQVAIGQGLVTAMNFLSTEANTSADALGGLKGVGNQTSKAMFGLALGFNVVARGITYFVKFLGLGAGELIAFTQVAWRMEKDVRNAFSNVAKGAFEVVKGLGKALTGDFSGALESFKKSTEIKIDFSPTKAAIRNTQETLKLMQQSVDESGAGLKNAWQQAMNFGDTYTKYTDATLKIQQAKDALNKQREDAIKGSKEESDAQKEATKQLEEYQKKLISVRDDMVKTGDELKTKLTDSFKKLSTDIAGMLQGSNQSLADIVVKAEQDRADLTRKQKEIQDQLQKDLSEAKPEDIAKIQERANAEIEANKKALAEQEKILADRVGFEERAAKQIEDIKKRLADAGLDPNALNLDALKNEKSLEEEIANARYEASLSSFALFEKQQNEKLLKLTTDFILEATLIQQKIDKQKAFEDDLTTFLTSENLKRKQAVEAFANASILKYGEMATALKDVVSLQSQLSAIGTQSSTSSLPKFHDGGYVGAAGGLVHPGEFVVPANLVQSNPDLISMLDKARTQNNSIVINNAQAGNTDLRTLTEEMFWRFSKM